uniref:Uncharacterized protein n=1 Tax=Candidatus Kentrum sp. LFY TaxID=2126342 RepID=A0A450V4X3_9GAMM|nr:MAG: hypothetical protein BECKLFY1418B_GA0070995_11603 [Candidatus Kentron sp. LFY]VFK01898.1 MAG: hypothetical protein BECKLFY1418A_GA0070994_11663 [Candidatus Kentron sp. LFY]
MTPRRHTGSIQATAHRMIPHTWKILYTTTTNENHGVLLQIVPFTPDIRGNLHSIRQPYTGHLAKRGIRLFRGRCIYSRTYPPSLRTTLQRRNVTFHSLPLARLTNKLIDRCHPITTPSFSAKNQTHTRISKKIKNNHSLQAFPAKTPSSKLEIVGYTLQESQLSALSKDT